MPILEAKAVGVPVITSNLEPMNEVGQDYAHFVNAGEISRMEHYIRQILNKKDQVLNSNNDSEEAGQKGVSSYVIIYQSLLLSK